jgi:tetratricopeptide (TPR) repeat protein
MGCATASRENVELAYRPDSFRVEILARVPDLSQALSEAPFVIDSAIIERARARVLSTPRGPARVQTLVDFLMDPEPEGLGLAYDWASTGSASVTIERGRGNCVSLASVLVGLGRGLDWPIFYAEARTRRPETQAFEEVTALSDHMAVIIAAKSVQLIVDFTGLVEDIYSIRPIDDLTAYAHVINNIAAQSVMSNQGTMDTAAWTGAIAGFDLATRIEPTLGRAWNNKGIALSKLGRFEEAREAYQRAVELDTAFGSAGRNLSMMETRARGKAEIIETPIPK